MKKNMFLGLAVAAVFSTTANAGTLDDVKKKRLLF
jgi:hypothetical protein